MRQWEEREIEKKRERWEPREKEIEKEIGVEPWRNSAHSGPESVPLSGSDTLRLWGTGRMRKRGIKNTNSLGREGRERETSSPSRAES